MQTTGEEMTQKDIDDLKEQKLYFYQKAMNQTIM